MNKIPSKCCSVCKKVKSLSAFGKQSKHKDGLRYACKECVNFRKRNYPTTKQSQQYYALQWKFNLSREGYNLLYEHQNGCCAICKKHQIEFSRALAVDHNHKTGKIRGLLCIKCNLGLGNFDESRGTLIKAMQYLKKYQEK